MADMSEQEVLDAAKGFGVPQKALDFLAGLGPDGSSNQALEEQQLRIAAAALSIIGFGVGTLVLHYSYFVSFFLTVAERAPSSASRKTTTFLHTLRHIYSSKGPIWVLGTLKTSLFTTLIFKFARTYISWTLLPVDDQKWPLTPALLIYELVTTALLEPLDIAFTQKLLSKTYTSTFTRLQRFATVPTERNRLISALIQVFQTRVVHMAITRIFGRFVQPLPDLGWKQPALVVFCHLWAYLVKLVWITNAHATTLDPAQPTVVPVFRPAKETIIRKFIWSQLKALRLVQELVTYSAIDVAYFTLFVTTVLVSFGKLGFAIQIAKAWVGGKTLTEAYSGMSGETATAYDPTTTVLPSGHDEF